MPNTQDYTPLPRRIRPIFVMYELSRDPEECRNDPVFLKKLLELMEELAQPNSSRALRFFLQPFGQSCNSRLQSAPAPLELHPEAILGCETVSLTQALQLLDRHLSRGTALFSPEGYQYPVILFFSRCAMEPGVPEAILRLRQNRWFAGSYKWVLHHEKTADPRVVADLLNCSQKELPSSRLFRYIPRDSNTLRAIAARYGLSIVSVDPVSDDEDPPAQGFITCVDFDDRNLDLY